jgi:hypothetical protein
MTNLRRRAEAIAREHLEEFKRAMGIESPSRIFADLRWDKLVIDGVQWSPSPPAPWYSARGPQDTYETPELRAAARRVRRLIRRHWYALLFEPDGPIAASVRAIMKAPPIEPRPELDIYQQIRNLLDVRAIELASPTALDWYETGITRP